MFKVLITGNSGLAKELASVYSKHLVTCVSRSNGYNINYCSEWCREFKDYDILFNCCYSEFGQVSVLENFYHMWGSLPNKSIINIGSIVTSYPRTEKEKDHDFWPYRLHKIALQHTFEKLVTSCNCHIQLINPGLFESNMVKHLTQPKMNIRNLALQIQDIASTRSIKRVDLWA